MTLPPPKGSSDYWSLWALGIGVAFLTITIVIGHWLGLPSAESFAVIFATFALAFVVAGFYERQVEREDRAAGQARIEALLERIALAVESTPVEQPAADRDRQLDANS